MARKLSAEFAGNEPAATIVEPKKSGETKATDEKAMEKRWLPLPLNGDGEPDTSKLPDPVTKIKERVRRLNGDGPEYITKELVWVRPGDPRYSVTPAGEVIAWYKKRGGIGRKLVFQFKRQYKDDEKGRSRKLRDNNFRKFLKKQGIPGA